MPIPYFFSLFLLLLICNKYELAQTLKNYASVWKALLMSKDSSLTAPAIHSTEQIEHSNLLSFLFSSPSCMPAFCASCAKAVKSFCTSDFCCFYHFDSTILHNNRYSKRPLHCLCHTPGDIHKLHNTILKQGSWNSYTPEDHLAQQFDVGSK